MIIELSEDDFYSLEKGKNTGIFYYKDVCTRLHCVVFLPEKEPIRNIWNIEKLAFEWMNKFLKDFSTQSCSQAVP